jgi:hypothetical protein
MMEFVGISTYLDIVSSHDGITLLQIPILGLYIDSGCLNILHCGEDFLHIFDISWEDVKVFFIVLPHVKIQTIYFSHS